MNYVQYDEHRLRQIVGEGGGQYVGIQEGLAYDLVLFNSCVTGSTLALRVEDVTPQKVHDHIAAHEALWKRN
jgi:hypothetical protein